MYALFFILGSVFGSFLNVVIDRLSTGRGIFFGRSYCEKCKKKLTPLELIPVVSYLFLKGRCRHCKAKIPLRLFAVEVLTGILFVSLSYLVINGSLEILPALFLAIILWSFMGIFFADLDYGIIPDGLVFVSLFSTVFLLGSMQAPLLPHLATGLATFAFFFALFFVTRGKGMGFGDVKLSFVLGFLLGFPNIIVALYLAFLTGAGVSIILVIWRRIRFFGGTIPFGPFLIISAVISLFYGNEILKLFLSRFF